MSSPVAFPDSHIALRKCIRLRKVTDRFPDRVFFRIRGNIYRHFPFHLEHLSIAPHDEPSARNVSSGMGVHAVLSIGIAQHTLPGVQDAVFGLAQEERFVWSLTARSCPTVCVVQARMERD
jgi:hypothetical protein